MDTATARTGTDFHTCNGRFGHFGTSIPVQDTSESSVRHQPGTRHFDKKTCINPVPPHRAIKIHRLIIVPSDSELQIFTTRSDTLGF